MNKILKKFMHGQTDIVILRLSVIFIFALFGTYKWFNFEVMALEPILSQSWLTILYTLFGHFGASYFLGVVENITFTALIIGFLKPKVGVIGDLLVILMGITTLSILPQLSHIDSFIIKDILLIGAGLVLLKFDLKRTYQYELN